MGFHRFYLKQFPYYLARHYWWAYLWSPLAWFFDHQPIINTILFWQYRTLMQATLGKLDSAPVGRLLQLSCVYGSLTPNLARRADSGPQAEPLYIADISRLQLQRAQAKAGNLSAALMNAEQLAYRDNSFDTVVVFFLLHEMTEPARRNVLAEYANRRHKQLQHKSHSDIFSGFYRVDEYYIR